MTGPVDKCAIDHCAIVEYCKQSNNGTHPLLAYPDLIQICTAGMSQLHIREEPPAKRAGTPSNDEVPLKSLKGGVSWRSVHEVHGN